MKRILQKIGDFFRNIFGKEYAWIKAKSHLAVKVTNILKEIVENPATGFIVDLTKTEVDNEVLHYLRKIVPVVAEEMAIAHGLIQASTTNADMWGAIITELKSRVPEGRAGFYIEFAGRVNKALSDGKLSLPEAVALAQLIYAENAK